MAGVTDTLFRRVIRASAAWPADDEFTSSEGITAQREENAALISTSRRRASDSAQLFGANPAVMAEDRKNGEDLATTPGHQPFGCPAKKVVKVRRLRLLRDLPLLEDIFQKRARRRQIPLTIKLRAGWDENSSVAGRGRQNGGKHWCGRRSPCIRALASKVTPAPRLEHHAAVRQAVKIPVIGTATSTSPKTAARMVSETAAMPS